MKNSFVMRAPTVSGDWYNFTVGDCPILLTDNTFILVGKPNSPVMYCDVYRGEEESGLFEGDVVYCDDTSWLVCYDRGFYAINKDYAVRYLYTMHDFRVIGVSGHDVDFPVPYSRRLHHKFSYKDVVFNLWDFKSCEKDGIHIRRYAKALAAEDIHQEAGVRINNRKAYLGYKYNGNILVMRGGRLVYEDDTDFIDIATGGKLDGYIPQAFE